MPCEDGVCPVQRDGVDPVVVEQLTQVDVGRGVPRVVVGRRGEATADLPAGRSQDRGVDVTDDCGAR